MYATGDFKSACVFKYLSRFFLASDQKEGRYGACRMEMKVRMSVEFIVSDNGLEDALAEYDEITVEGLVREILDKSVACDEIQVTVSEGPKTLEDFDEQSQQTDATAS